MAWQHRPWITDAEVAEGLDMGQLSPGATFAQGGYPAFFSLGGGLGFFAVGPAQGLFYFFNAHQDTVFLFPNSPK